MTPFFKQCFVTLGVALNMSQFAFVLGFTAVLLPQLQSPGSPIPVSDDSGSWIAAIPGFAILFGNFIIPKVMGKYGRKIAHIASIIPIIIGWICIAAANGVPLIVLGRFLHGLSLGLSVSLGPILIAEYTSPQNRGAFLSYPTFMMAVANLIVHAFGSYLSWQKTAIICATVSAVNLVVVLLSPESPSWLATQKRYEDCKKVFRWLRGRDEDDELNKLITANQEEDFISDPNHSFVQDLKSKLAYFRLSVVKKEFYKPIIIMIHVYTLVEWAGINVLSPFIHDVIKGVINTKNIDVPLLIVTVDTQRIFTNLLASYVIKKVKRRTILVLTTIMCILIQLSIAGYSYARSSNVLPFDTSFIGAILIHLHMFAIAIGSMPLSVVLSGEIFPIRFRGLAGAFSALFFSFNFFITVKTFPYLCKYLGLHGTYVVHAAVVTYSLVVIWFLLPETKDRTLQEIEEEFTERSVKREDAMALKSLVNK